MRNVQTITISWPPGLKDLALERIKKLSPGEAHRALSGYLGALVLADVTKAVLHAPISLARSKWDALPSMPTGGCPR